MEGSAAGIGLHVNAHKTEYMCFNQTGDISTLNRSPLKLVDKFTYLGSSVSSTETHIDTRLTKAWTLNRILVIWKSDLTDKMKRSFFQAAIMLILLYGCTTWTLTKQLEKKLDGNCTKMLRAILNRGPRSNTSQSTSCTATYNPSRKLFKLDEPDTQDTSRDELISDVLLWTSSHGRTKSRWPARTYIQQLCEDTGFSPEDLPEAMIDRQRWWERVTDIRADGMTRWWWYVNSSISNSSV